MCGFSICTGSTATPQGQTIQNVRDWQKLKPIKPLLTTLIPKAASETKKIIYDTKYFMINQCILRDTINS